MELMVGRAASLNDLAINEGSDDIAALGPHREVLVNTVLGKYYTLTRKGRVFIHSTVVAGVAFPISTTTTPVFGIWNKLGSGKLIIPLLYGAAYVSGTNVQTGVNLALLTNTGAALGTLAPLTAITEVAPRNALIGVGQAAVANGFSTATITTAGVFLMSLGFNTFTGAATVPVGIGGPNWFDFDGTLAIPPGNMIYTMGNAASVGLYQQTLIAAELNY
jgi:hypothetical protein